MAVTFNDIKKKKVPSREGQEVPDDLGVFKKEKTLRPWETFEEKEEVHGKDLLDEINERLDFEKQTLRKKRLVKKDFIKVPPPTEDEKREKKRKIQEKILTLEENKKPGISPDLEKRLKKVPPPTEDEKREKKRKIQEKILTLEENKKPGISPDLEKRLKKGKSRYFDSLLH